MRFCLVTYGSRGDVQPFIALALGLKANGHAVTLAAPGNFSELIESFGIDCYPLHGDSEALVNSPECLRVIQSGSNIGFVRMALKETHNMRGPLLADIYEACINADGIIAANTCVFYAAAIAERLKIKWMIIQLNPPMVPTKAFPMLMADFPDISRLNSYSYSMVNYILYLLQKKDNAEFRQRMGLRPLKGSLFRKIILDKIPMIQAFSEELIARPDDWPEQVSVSGFLTLPEANNAVNATLPGNLSAWLDEGEPPLYIGFGSIPFPNPAMLAGVIEDLLGSGSRVLFCKGWSTLPDLPLHKNLLVIEQANHIKLMLKCRAAVIHGGIGTVAGALKAGIPLIVASIFVDQPVWGKIIAKKKLGVHIPWRKLSAKKINDALETMLKPEIARNLAAVSARLNEENGVRVTVDKIETYFDLS